MKLDRRLPVPTIALTPETVGLRIRDCLTNPASCHHTLVVHGFKLADEQNAEDVQEPAFTCGIGPYICKP